MQQNHFKTFSERAITVGDDGVVAGHWVHSVVEHRARRNARTAAVTRTRLRRLNDVGQPMEVRGGISMKLTIGTKTLAIMFFVIEVQDNYSVILYRD
jgi:hypothetical protein